jgi:hypothetical protein
MSLLSRGIIGKQVQSIMEAISANLVTARLAVKPCIQGRLSSSYVHIPVCAMARLISVPVVSHMLYTSRQMLETKALLYPWISVGWLGTML